MPKHKIILGSDWELYIGKNRKIAQFEESGMIDWDGSMQIREGRTIASENPLEIVSDIRNTFIKQIKKNPEVLNNHWAAGSYYNHPIGGHIHIDTPDNIFKQKFAQDIDQYLGVICLLLEKRKDGLKRRSKYWNYGQYGSYRSCSYGVEIRSLSSWITSPYIATAVLCLAKIIANEILNNGFQAKTYVTSNQFNKMKTDEIRPKFPEIWAEIEKMELFKEYEEYIRIIPKLINAKKTWIPKQSFKEVWSLVGFDTKPIKITYNNIWQKWADSIGEKLNKLIGRELPEVAAE